MKINRRAFLSLTAISGASIFENSWSRSPIQLLERYRLSILQGYTTPTSAEFSVVFWKHQPVTAQVVLEDGSSLSPETSHVVARPDSDYQVLKLYFQGLELGAKYRLVMKDENDIAVDERNFKTLDTSLPNPRIAVLSCMNDYFHRKRMWSSLSEQKPDMMFFIGDSVYADHPSRIERRAADPRQLWERFVESRNKLAVYKMKDLIPILAVWDDHDFGSNNSNRHYPYVNESKHNFLTFFAQDGRDNGLEHGPGISMKFEAFGKDFYFLDGRSFRTAEKETNPSVLGQDQEGWLFSHLRGSSRPAWLITGSQWFGGYFEKESYEHTHPFSFKTFLRDLKNTGARVQFVSGDVHFSEVMEIEADILGYTTLEICSSSMHSLAFPGWHRTKHNPRRIKASSSHNFTLVQFTEKDQLHCHLKCIGVGNRTLYSVRYGIPKENDTL